MQVSFYYEGYVLFLESYYYFVVLLTTHSLVVVAASVLIYSVPVHYGGQRRARYLGGCDRREFERVSE
jgi:hypothetical protein